MSVILLDLGASTVARRLLQRVVPEVQVMAFAEIEGIASKDTSKDVLVIPVLEQLNLDQLGVLWHLLMRRKAGQLWLAGKPCAIPYLPSSLTWESGPVEGLKARPEFLPDCAELQVNLRAAFVCPLGQPLIETFQPAALAAWAYRPTSNSGELILSTLDLLRYSPFSRERDRECVLEALMARLLAGTQEPETPVSAADAHQARPHLDDAVLNAIALAAAVVVRQGRTLTAEAIRESLADLLEAPLEGQRLKAGLTWLEAQALDPTELVVMRGLEPFLRRLVR